MTSEKPTVLALDYDGVLCDGMKEYFHTAWRAYCNIWNLDYTVIPEGLPQKFYQVRPLITTGWEMPMLLRALMKGYTEEQMAQDWEGLAQQLLVEENLSSATLATAIDGVRDHWISTDPDGWMAEQEFYSGVIDRLAGWLTMVPVVIISTKEGRFIQQLLQQQGVDLTNLRILGKEVQQPKTEILRWLKAEQGEEASFWFVEDRLKALQAVEQQPDLQNVRLFLATWGYNTAAERASVQSDSNIHCLTLDQFCQDFSTWLQPAIGPEMQAVPAC